MSAYRFANATSSAATAASQAGYDTATALAFKLLLRGDAMLNIPSDNARALVNLPVRGNLVVGFNKQPSGDLRFNGGYAGEGYINLPFTPAVNVSAISSEAWYTLYAHLGGSAFAPNRWFAELFDAAGESLGATTSALPFAGIPNAGSGNGALRVGNNGSTAHEWTVGGVAIYSAMLTGADRSAVPTIDDANLLGLYIASAGTGAEIADQRGGTGLAISGGGAWQEDANPWAPATMPVADTLRFVTQPADTAVGSTMAPVSVEAWDSILNARDTAYAGTVTLTPVGGSYLGTTAVAFSDGLATFDDISPQTIGSAFTFYADDGVLPTATSVPFDVTVPSGGGASLILEEPMLTPVVRNTADPKKRVVLLRVRNADGSPWAGGTAGVKPELNGVPLDDDIVRLHGELHAAQLTQPQSNTSEPYLYVTLPGSGSRLAASGVGLVSAADVTAVGASASAVATAVVAQAQAAGVALTEAQSAALVSAVFKAIHYANGYGVRRAAGDSAMELLTPGEETVSVPTTPASGRPALVAAGAGVS